MEKKLYTFVVIHPESSKIRKISIPSWALYLGGLANVIGMITLLIFLFNFSRMSVKVLEFNRLRSELEGLKIENQLYHASTTQLGEKLWSLESLAQKLASSVGLDKKIPQTQPAPNKDTKNKDTSAVTFPIRESPQGSEIAKASLVPELLELDADTEQLEQRFHNIEKYFSDSSSRRARTPSIWPAWGLLWDRFGPRESTSAAGEAEYHSGIDISTAYGNQVLASADGIVISTERRSDYGNLIVIDHGSGLTTRYAHLSAFHCSEGQRVKRGEVIGYVGSSGRSTGPHLHYEVRLHGHAVNPLRYLSKAPRG